ncbi:hypothetical protein HRbin20_00149 [bacterium HR20]|nr:hypothetical protein HRbin20_00149 [bacterium HR20]
MLTLDHVGTPPTVVNTCPSLPAASLLTAIAAVLLMSASVIVPSAIFALVTASLAIAGFGYVPVKSPPALPVGGKLVGAPVIFDHETSLTFASVTEPSASSAVPTTPLPSCKLLYAPLTSPLNVVADVRMIPLSSGSVHVRETVKPGLTSIPTLSSPQRSDPSDGRRIKEAAFSRRRESLMIAP